MQLEIQKFIVGTLISIASFLGWETEDYIHRLPKNVEVLLENSTPPPAATTTKKTPAPEIKKVTPKEAINVFVKKPAPKTTPTQITPQKPSTQNVVVKSPVVTTPPKTPITLPSQNITPEKPQEKLSLDEKIKKSTANILCSRRVSNGIEKHTGSAAAIDSSGVYLTNAHVAINILLEQTLAYGEMSCFIRTGTPAKNTYKAEIVYIPKQWILNNKNILTNHSPTGSGEKDYAIIRAVPTSTGNEVSLSSYFQITTSSLSTNDSLYLSGYPASPTSGNLLDSSLYSLTQKVSVKDVYSFNAFSSDSFGTSATLLAENGSSGGAVASTDGKLIGIMFATSIDNYSQQKNIRGITLSYIKRDLLKNTGKSLDWYIENANTEASRFKKEDAGSLSSILTSRSY